MRLFRLISILLFGFILIAFLSGITLLCVADRYVVNRSAQLLSLYPDYARLANPNLNQTTTYLFSDGSVVGETYIDNRKSVPLSVVSPIAVDAFIAAEDKGFWTEPGIDIYAIIRSAINDAQHLGGRPAGASTIAQQVVKNIVMHNPPMNMSRKIDEAILALRAVNQFGHQDLLQLYLNEIYLGEGSYGIRTASERYFGVGPNNLNLAQSAMLAGLPKSPVNYDPILHPQAAFLRRQYVLQRMLDDGYINEAQMIEANSAPLPTVVNRAQIAGISEIGDGWAMEAATNMMTKLGLRSAHNAPITVQTTINVEYQNLAQIALQVGILSWEQRHGGWTGPAGKVDSADELSTITFSQGIYPNWMSAYMVKRAYYGHDGLCFNVLDQSGSPYSFCVDVRLARNVVMPVSGDVIMAGRPVANRPWVLGQPVKLNGSIVVINPTNDAILALVGGYDYSPSQFNRALYASRQPGSSFKPFIYLAAAEMGDTPDSPVLDAPIALSQGGSLPLWTPEDDGDRPLGVVTLEKALALSLNDAAVRMLYQIGLEKMSSLANLLGIYPSVTTYTAALGAQGTQPVSLSGAYAALANHGMWTNPYIISSIKQGDDIVWQPEQQTQVIPVKAADAIATSLAGTVLYGTASSMSGLEKLYPGLAGKTGTSQNFHDAWFEGFWPGHVVIGVHVGYDMPKPIGNDAFGADVALPIFRDFLMMAFPAPKSK